MTPLRRLIAPLPSAIRALSDLADGVKGLARAGATQQGRYHTHIKLCMSFCPRFPVGNVPFRQAVEDSAPSTLWICATTAAPSPTAAATRLVEPARTSPIAKTPA